jgi:DNA anti-recombination protein RmuC
MARADDVKSLVDTLTERVNNFIKLFDELNTAHKQAAQLLTDHRLKYTEEIGRLMRAVEALENLTDRQQSAEHTIATLKIACSELSGWKERQEREQEERRRRWWAFGPNIIAAIITSVGSIITLIFSTLIAYFILKK